ncbi:hypothetical protein JMN32_09415 [Fulvivirga sp. 29W222]|uniref:3-oxoacyl-ACP synthase n=1 Tax=Fulvivirga marina TaxID=2494733 RepID=A0A937FWX6_9BACT|nr:hypothetical protein [Fulvivirga marina]MBL6446527.1 hypothetical protein [Fulvivirga marina]
MKLHIQAHSRITPISAYAHGELVLNNKENLTFNLFGKELYRYLTVQYPKFFKMDELCQLAFLGTELLTSHIDHWDGEKVAIVLGNKSSSLSSDKRHYDSIADKNNYFPSPAVFVYTLPNIMLGELCIRHKITGENTCFLMEKLDAEFMHTYVKHLFEVELYQYCITGFVDYSDNDYVAELYLVSSQNDTDTPLSQNFDKNFNQIIF